MLHDAFLAGGAFIHVPDGVVVEQPIVVLHWSRGRRRAIVPAHAGRRRARAPRSTVLDRFGSPDTRPPRRRRGRAVVGDDAHLRYLSVQEHGPRTWHLGLPARARRPRRHAAHRRPSRSAATTPGCAARRCSRRRRRERPARRVLRRRHPDARLPHAAGPRRAVDAQRPAVQGRGRGRRAARCTRASSACGRAAQKSNAYQTNRNLVLTEGASAESIPNLEIEANDVRCSHASHRRPDRRRPALLPRVAAACRPRRRSA